MVNREQLTVGALRAYELGRLRAAARATAYVVPVALLCAMTTGEREECACLGFVIVGASMFLRWRHRSGGESVTTGILAGSAPLLAGLLIGRIEPDCNDYALASWCTAACLAVGVAAGAWAGARALRQHASFASWLTSIAIALLVASLGCIGLGLAGVVGAGAGLLAGSALAPAALRFVA